MIIFSKRIFLPALALMMLSGVANAENISVSTPQDIARSGRHQGRSIQICVLWRQAD